MLYFALSNSPSQGGWKLPRQSIDFQREKWLHFCAVLCFLLPVSRSLCSKFDILGSMFPQLEHLAVEQSSASPSVFSRYGIHSLPSILIVNQTSRIRYHGPKDLPSILQFYEKTTGFEPVRYVAEKELVVSGGHNKYMIQSSNELSPTEILKREPYLAFAVLFLCLRLILCIFPKGLFRLKAFWVSYTPSRLNLEIFGETSQLFARILHMVDVRRVWTKLNLCKTGNFHRPCLGFFAVFHLFGQIFFW